MLPWRELNTKGRMLVIACCLNMYAAVVMAMEGSWWSVFSVCMAMFCGMMTYNTRYRIITAQEMNKTRDTDTDE